METIGLTGTGTFVQTGGSNSVSSLFLGYNGNGSYSLSGGVLSAGTESFGYAGTSTGVFNQTGGTNTTTSLVFISKAGGPCGTYNLNGGILRFGTIPQPIGVVAFNFGGGTLQASGSLNVPLAMTLTGAGGNANVDTAGYAGTLSGLLSGAGGLNKLGAGTLTLTDRNTYQGSTTISAGALEITGAIGSSAVTVNSGATLLGRGIIGGPVAVAGTLEPGDGRGIMTVNSSVTFQPGSTFDVEVFDLTAGASGYHELTTTGPVSLAGSLDLTFDSFTPTGHNVLFLINNTGTGATTGTFQYPDNTEIGTFNGFNWYITYEANNAATPSLSGGNDVAIYSVPVPEPAALVLLATGLLSFLAFAWRRRR